MSVPRASNDVSKFSSMLVAFLILFSTLIMANYSPNVRASVSGDLSIDSSSPSNDDYIPAYEATYFEVTVTNQDSFISPNRVIDWYVCLGEEVSNICINNKIAQGEIAITNLLPAETLSFTSGDAFYPNGLNETITVVYQFEELDFNPSNDVINFIVNASLQYTDVIIETNENLIDQLTGLAIYDGEKILSNNTEYELSFSGFANLCASCQLNTTLGWQLWDENQTEMVNENYIFEENYPKFSFYKAFTMSLPTFNHSEDGTFTLIYGIFNSTGNPFGDLYDSNNLNSISIIINTELDISIDSVYPSHNPSSSNYFYGMDMITVQVSNNANMTAINVQLELELSAFGSNTVSQICIISIIMPNQQKNCVFDMTIDSENVLIKAMLQDNIMNNQDTNPLDNVLEEISGVSVPQLMSSIEIDNEKEWYTDNEIITVSADINPFSSAPINFSWWYMGIIDIDYGQTTQINTSDYGLGSHDFKLITSDSLGNSETIYFNILVYTEVQISNLPLYEASAISATDTVQILHDSTLPIEREGYNVGGGKSPLFLLQFDLINTQTNQSDFNGQNWIEIELSLFDLIPSQVSLSSVELRKLDSFSDTDWEFFNSDNVGYINQTKMSIKVYEATTILFIGELGEPNIEALNFSVDLIANGNFDLSWQPYGDIESEYILGWNIHQKLVPEFGGTIFPSPQIEYNEEIWDSLVEDSFREFIPIDQTNWQDTIAIPDGYCASYAIIPVDRTGETFNHLANVSMIDGDAAFICGDSTPPSTSVINMQNSWRFTNDTACFDILKDWNMCYEVTISWTWPQGEENETWNLYRIEQNPNGINLHLIEPVLENIAYTAGENYQYTENGIDDDSIRPLKTFYYILTPTDQFGNERTVAIYPSPNIERVHIEDDWWSYNQHIIPEPEPVPEPPLNNEWLGNFSDSLDKQEFKTAGIVTLVTLCLGIIMLAFIAKRLKRLRKVIKARNRRLAESMANEFEDLYE